MKNNNKNTYILIFCVIGLLLSGWLSYQKLNGSISSLVGCGAASSCENILGSKWSVVLKKIPVSLFSVALYGALILSVLKKVPYSDFFSRVFAWVLISAAGWFTLLQVVKFDDFCLYCMSAHFIGIIVAVLILWQHRSTIVGEFKVAVLGFFFVFCLAVLQVKGPSPDTHKVDVLDYYKEGAAKNSLKPIMLPGGRNVSTSDVPVIGNKNSKYVIIEYFDYTCNSCRSMHQHIKEVMRQDEEKYAIVALTVPLNPDCNPYYNKRVEVHLKACFLSHFSIAVWAAKPEKFAEYHDWLFQLPTPSVEQAKLKAIELVGEKSFIASLRDPAVRAQMEGNFLDYAQIVKKNRVMPKLLLGEGKVTHGRAKDAEALKGLLEKELVPL